MLQFNSVWEIPEKRDSAVNIGKYIIDSPRFAKPNVDGPISGCYGQNSKVFEEKRE